MARRKRSMIRTTAKATPPPADNTFSPPSNVSTDATTQIQALSSSKRKARGFTQMNSIWKLKGGEKLEVTLNAKGCPVRKPGGRYTRFIGTVARRSDLCPLNYPRWSRFPKEMKDSIWKDQIEPRFIFSPVEHATNIKKWALEEIGMKWRQFKHNLKRKCFDLNESEDVNVKVAEERLKDRVDLDQYRFLVRYWLSKEGKDISEKNKANSCNDEPHCAGSKAFRQIAEELTKQNGVRPSDAVIYCHTRKNKEGNYVNDVVASHGAQLEEVIAEEQAERNRQEKAREEDLNDNANSNDENPRESDGYMRVKGKEKRKCLNREEHLDISTRNNSDSEAQQNRLISLELTAKLDKMAAQMEQIKKQQAEKIEQMQREQDEKIEQMQRKQDEKIEQMQRKHVEEMKELRDMITLMSELHSLGQRRVSS